MANELVYYPGDTDDLWHELEGDHEHPGSSFVGFGPDGVLNGAWRFPSVVASGALDYAQLEIYMDARSGSEEIKGLVYGLDVDNVGDFNTDPNGVSKTSASTTSGTTQGSGNFWSINVKSMVNEIIARGGWNSGNAIGLICYDNGTTQASGNQYLTNTSLSSRLVIRQAAEPDFTPAPGSIAAPTFPAASDYGMKFSKPGVNVLTATEAQLYFTTRKRSLKIIREGDASCTASVEKLITHGLAYSPAAIAYVKGGGKRLQLSRAFNGATDPIGGGVEGFVGSTDSNLKILVDTNADVYYYIFIDPLNE